MNLNNITASIKPQQKWMIVVGLAVALFVGPLYLTLDTGDDKDHTYRPKVDKEVSVLTDTPNVRIGLDNLSGQLSHAESKIRQLENRVQAMQTERDAMKNEEGRDKAWRERFDALTSEMQQLKAALNANNRAAAAADAKGKAKGKDNRGSGTSPDDSASAHEPAEYVSGNIFDRPADDLGKPRAKLTISVVEEPVDETAQSKPSSKKKKKSDMDFYIPAGSILTGTIITGADYPTGKGSFESPTPALIRLSKSAILPNRYTSDIRECFLLASGHGELASERAQLRAETISCIRHDGKIIESRIAAYVSGEDGKAGVKGRLVSKQGQMIARTLVSGFMSGMAEAFDYDPVPVLSTTSTGTVQYQENFSSDAAKGGIAKGAMNALDRVSEFYMDLAEQMVPVVEINAGRQVDVIVTSGSRLTTREAALPEGIGPSQTQGQPQNTAQN